MLQCSALSIQSFKQPDDAITSYNADAGCRLVSEIHSTHHITVYRSYTRNGIVPNVKTSAWDGTE